MRSVAPRYQDDLLTAAYASDLETLLGWSEADFAVHGHMHHPVDYEIGPVRVVTNPRGYVGLEAGAATWRPKVIELEASKPLPSPR